jgi:NADH-quinone oxidoreductase subunit L
VLSVLAAFGGGLNLPFTGDLKFLDRWLEPVLGETQVVSNVATSGKWALAIVSVLAGLVGIFGAYTVYARKRLQAFEPKVLANAWYVDATYAAVVGGPGRQAFDAVTYSVDAGVVDGAVNGTASLVGLVGSQLRKLQTGFIRNYAWGIAAGAALILVWFMSRGMA